MRKKILWALAIFFIVSFIYADWYYNPQTGTIDYYEPTGVIITGSYLTLGLNATLTQERVLTAGDSITFTDTGAGGTLTLSLADRVEINESFTFDAFQTATGDGDTTIDWGLGNNMYFTFGAQNEIIRFTAPPGSAVVRMIIKQDGVGSRTIDWSNVANILWPGNVEPTLSTGAAAVDIIVFLYDGTSWHGLFNGNFS